MIEFRWDGRPEDRATYDLIFEIALVLSKQPSPMRDLAALLFSVINSWEKNSRLIPVEVISNAYQTAKAFHDFGLASDPDLAAILETP